MRTFRQPPRGTSHPNAACTSADSLCFLRIGPHVGFLGCITQQAGGMNNRSLSSPVAEVRVQNQGVSRTGHSEAEGNCPGFAPGSGGSLAVSGFQKRHPVSAAPVTQPPPCVPARVSFPAYGNHQSCRKGLACMAQLVKDLPAVREGQVQSLGREDPLEKEMATHSRILAWRSPWTEERGGLQSKESDVTEQLRLSLSPTAA